MYTARANVSLRSSHTHDRVGSSTACVHLDFVIRIDKAEFRAEPRGFLNKVNLTCYIFRHPYRPER